MDFKYKMGDVVTVYDDILDKSLFGIICTQDNCFDGHNYYYVLVYEENVPRFWCRGVFEEDITPMNFHILDVIKHFQFWMNTNFSTKTGIKLKPKKFGQKYDYWKLNKEEGAKKAGNK